MKEIYWNGKFGMHTDTENMTPTVLVIHNEIQVAFAVAVTLEFSLNLFTKVSNNIPYKGDRNKTLKNRPPNALIYMSK